GDSAPGSQTPAPARRHLGPARVPVSAGADRCGGRRQGLRVHRLDRRLWARRNAAADTRAPQRRAEEGGRGARRRQDALQPDAGPAADDARAVRAATQGRLREVREAHPAGRSADRLTARADDDKSRKRSEARRELVERQEETMKLTAVVAL